MKISGFSKFALSLTLLSSGFAAASATEPLLTKQEDFSNLINIKNTPAGPVDWTAFVFADKGAWMAYSLPEKENTGYARA